MSKREREDERPDETPVTVNPVIDLQATTYTLVTGLLLSRLLMLTVAGFSMVSFT